MPTTSSPCVAREWAASDRAGASSNQASSMPLSYVRSPLGASSKIENLQAVARPRSEEAGGGSSASAPSAPLAPPATGEQTVAVPPEVVDWQTALAAMGNSPAILLPMVRHLQQLDIGSLVAAADADDIDSARGLAHRMCGEASYVRAGAFCAACRELVAFEGDAEAARTLVEAVVARFEELATVLARVEESLGQDSEDSGGGGGNSGGSASMQQ